MYEIIDENLKLASCGIGDLTLEQASYFLSKWEKGANIGSLMAFTDPAAGYFVLNKDNANYEHNLEMAKTYLSSREEDLDEYRGVIRKESHEMVNILDKFRNYRRIMRDLDIISHQSFAGIDYVVESVLETLEEKEMSQLFLMSQAYSYGVMNGKRMERARRKAVRYEYRD